MNLDKDDGWVYASMVRGTVLYLHVGITEIASWKQEAHGFDGSGALQVSLENIQTCRNLQRTQSTGKNTMKVIEYTVVRSMLLPRKVTKQARKIV